VRKRFSRLRDGLAKTRKAITEGIRGALGRGAGVDAAALESIEETLIAADLGVETAMRLVEALGERFSGGGSETEVREFLAAEIESTLSAAETEGVRGESGAPFVVMVAGVNGVGKTTTIGKLARLYRDDGREVILAAADTFRAAAGEQLSIWAERSGSQFVGGQSGGDAAAVAFDALEAAVARSADVLIVDTAGRLHTQKNLMQELTKVRRVLERRLPGSPHEVLLVIDANTGQNALSQARMFDEALGLTGLVLTKLDGTARGGIVVAIARELSVPVRYVGTGEGVEDLEPFDPTEFARGLLGVGAEGSETA
jgi:fused signal recognition particle receptor